MNNSKTPGPRGPPGISGPPGPRGYNGTQGNPGLPGYNGTQGPPGFSGSPGPRGYNGTQGNPGLPGYNGTQGPPGVSGSPGPRGYNGSQGPPGNSASGGLSLCSYNEKQATDTPSSYASAAVQETEPNVSHQKRIYLYHTYDKESKVSLAQIEMPHPTIKIVLGFMSFLLFRSFFVLFGIIYFPGFLQLGYNFLNIATFTSCCTPSK